MNWFRDINFYFLILLLTHIHMYSIHQYSFTIYHCMFIECISFIEICNWIMTFRRLMYSSHAGYAPTCHLRLRSVLSFCPEHVRAGMEPDHSQKYGGAIHSGFTLLADTQRCGSSCWRTPPQTRNGPGYYDILTYSQIAFLVQKWRCAARQLGCQVCFKEVFPIYISLSWLLITECQ